MEIEVVRQVSSRWRDGRTFAAMPGRRVTVDDSDLDAVAHMRHLIALGDVLETDAPIVGPPVGDEFAPEMADKTQKPARKSTAAKASGDE